MRQKLLDAAFETANELEGKAKVRAVLRIVRNAKKNEKDYVLKEAAGIARGFEGVAKAHALVEIADQHKARTDALPLLEEAIVELGGSKEDAVPKDWNETAERVFETNGRLRVEEAEGLGKEVTDEALDEATDAVLRIVNDQTRSNYLTKLLALK